MSNSNDKKTEEIWMKRRDELMRIKDRNTNPDVFSPSSYDEGVKACQPELTAKQAEIDEQCKINQYGQERELKLMNEVSELKRKNQLYLDTINSERETAKREYAKLENTISDKQSEIDELKSKLNTFREAIKEGSETLEFGSDKIAKRDAVIAEMKKALEKISNNIYEFENNGYVDLANEALSNAAKILAGNK